MANKNILNFKEACELTGLSKQYMYTLTLKRKIPYYKPFGKLLYFKREELENALLQNRVSTADEIDKKATAYITTGRQGGTE